MGRGGLVLVAAVLWAGAVQARVVTVTVDAGAVDRVDTPVSFRLDAAIVPPMDQPGFITVHRLVELAEGEDVAEPTEAMLRELLEREAIPAQLERQVDGTALVHFVLRGRTPAGSTRRFVMVSHSRRRAEVAGILPQPVQAELVADQVVVSQGEAELLRYQITPMRAPKGGQKFAASTFIHPLRTPSGFVVTEAQPSDHLHHLGVWWPWKYVSVDGKRFNGWELQFGEGMVRGEGVSRLGSGPVLAWFDATSQVIDRHNYDTERVILEEEATVRVWRIGEAPARGYVLDITVSHRPAVDEAVEIPQYRYSGFGYRGPGTWDKDRSTLLTSEGRQRADSNFTAARWVRVAGEAGEGKAAGVLLMMHPDNASHPEKLRTWDATMHDGLIFLNVNPVQDAPLTIEPKQTHVRRYRLFVFDGEVDEAEAERLWRDYAEGVGVGVRVQGPGPGVQGG